MSLTLIGVYVGPVSHLRGEPPPTPSPTPFAPSLRDRHVLS